MIMMKAEYKLEKDNCNGTIVQIQSNDKVLFNRLELAIDHIFKEFNEKRKKEC